jgi:Mycolic acid cyclopropane synthetase
MHWVRRLEAAREAAIAAAGIERYRVWRLYIAGMAHAFDRGWLSVAQVLAIKPLPGGPAPRPWARQYQYVPEALAPLSGRLDYDECNGSGAAQTRAGDPIIMSRRSRYPNRSKLRLPAISAKVVDNCSASASSSIGALRSVS